MVHGNRDYFSSIPLSTMYSMIDAGELAARLGSIVTFDRRGNVLWLTGFEEGLAEWSTWGRGEGFAVTVSTDKAFSGGYSCKLVPGRTPTYEAGISRHHYLPVSSKIGFEFSFFPSSALNYLYNRMYFYKDKKVHMCKIRYNHVGKTIDYWSSAGSYVPFITNIDLALCNGWWSVFKWVYDLEAGEYVRFIVNHMQYDLKGIAPEIADSSDSNNWYYDIGLVQANTMQWPTYVDNVIVTINE